MTGYAVHLEAYPFVGRKKQSGRFTPTGRASISALGMNRPAIIAIRKALVKLGSMSLTTD